MKTALCVLIIAGTALAGEPELPREGMAFRHGKVMAVYEDGVTIIHDTGLTKISLGEMTEAERAGLGFKSVPKEPSKTNASSSPIPGQTRQPAADQVSREMGEAGISRTQGTDRYGAQVLSDLQRANEAAAKAREAASRRVEEEIAVQRMYERDAAEEVERRLIQEREAQIREIEAQTRIAEELRQMRLQLQLEAARQRGENVTIYDYGTGADERRRAAARNRAMNDPDPARRAAALKALGY